MGVYQKMSPKNRNTFEYKICKKCNESKPVSSGFYKSGDNVKDTCKLCEKQNKKNNGIDYLTHIGKF